MFSVPLNPKLTEEQFFQFLEFCKEHKDYIFDIYTTVRIAPFAQDAMGDIIATDQAAIGAVQNALYLSQQTGIPLSATFNNIMVDPSEKNLDLFIRNFKPLYDAGIKIVTLPHTTWMLSGKIQKAFPELYVKNTILRNVQRPNEIYELAKAGFDYVNLDRDLMRDQETLKRIVKVKERIKKDFGKEIKISLLANEGCWGNCPVQDEHFEYNFTRKQAEDPTYFYTNLSKFTCVKWDVQDPSVEFKKANLPPWKEDWDEFLNELGIDVFKMHGRESTGRLWETMELIRRYANNEEILFDEFTEYLEYYGHKERPIDAWRKKIKSCKFDCWDCQYCFHVAKNKPKPKYVQLIDTAITNAIEEKSNIEDAKSIKGLTANRMKHLLNNICSIEDARYVEVGTYQGATLLSAIENNNVKAIAIDNWVTPEINPMREMEFEIVKNPKDILMKNIEGKDVTIIDSDIKDVKELPFKCNIFFYDGDHSVESHLEAFDKIGPYMDDTFVAVIDDFNWTNVQDAMEIIKKRYDVIYENKIMTSGENPSDFWNGVGMYVFKKKIQTIQFQSILNF
jgi:hypothetical protein